MWDGWIFWCLHDGGCWAGLLLPLGALKSEKKRKKHQISVRSWSAMARSCLFHPENSTRFYFFLNKDIFLIFKVSFQVKERQREDQPNRSGTPRGWICSWLPVSISASRKYFSIFLKAALGAGLRHPIITEGNGQQENFAGWISHISHPWVRKQPHGDRLKKN